MSSDSAAKGAPDGSSQNTVLLRLAAYTRPYASLVLLAIALTAAASGGRYARAYLMKPILDDVLMPRQAITQRVALPRWTDRIPLVGSRAEPEPGGSAPTADEERRQSIEAHIRESLSSILLAAAVLILGMPALMFGQAYVVEYVLGRVYVDIVREVCAKLLELPLGFHHGRARGDVLSRTMKDVDAAHRGVKLLFGDLVESVLMIVIGAFALFFISWRLAVISALLGPGIFGVIAVFNRRIRKSAHRRQEKVGDVTERLMEILAGIKVIKAFQAEPTEKASFQRETHLLFRRGMRVVKNRVLARSMVEMLNNGVVIGMLVLGILLVLDGGFGLTPGDLAAFALVLSTTYRPVRALAQDWVKLIDAEPSAERFFEILDAEGEVADAPDAISIDGVHRDIAFRDVSFSYGREPVLTNVSFDVKAGEVVALVGRTGAGKTTVADLLMRFHDPTSGCIEIDGVDVRRIARRSLMSQIAVVTQEPFLFDGTIRENIRYGRMEASDEEVLEASQAAHVDEFARSLPDGYATEVGTAGVRLSGGQRQRITIARALLRNPDILIFDEATSSLDSMSERLVQEAIESLFGGRTVFLIAHRFSTLRKADHIVVLDEGRVGQYGTHDELSRQGGLYRELLELQTQPSSPGEASSLALATEP